MTKRKYDLRWCVTSAADVGAPQLRKRWFCVAYKHQQTSMLTSMPILMPKFTWKLREMPARTSVISKSEARRRYSLLGNAVCPDAVRKAFSLLSHTDAADFKLTSEYSNAGAVIRGRLFTFSHPASDAPNSLQRTLVVTLIPGAFRATKPPSAQLTSGVLSGPRKIRGWGTPAHKVLGPANYLTNRNACMLETQVRFEATTPDDMRAQPINPNFVEWLMGYPKGWTKGYDFTQ